MWCATADPRCTLTFQISSRSVYFVALCWRKISIFAVFWTSAFSVVANWPQSDKVEHGCGMVIEDLEHVLAPLKRLGV